MAAKRDEDLIPDQPVFAFTTHRSGSTLLGRLLNCHPDLVVWGEHSGLVNNLAEIDYLIKRNREHVETQSGDAAWLEKFVDDAGFRASNLQPWTMPPHLNKARLHAREMIRAIFTQHLQPHQRWGFKEIRYHRPYVADYLLTLFPNAKFILLSRNVPDAAVSNILSSWSQEGLRGSMGAETEDLAHEIVRDVVYALIAAKTGMKRIKVKHPEQCFEISYSTLKKKDLAAACKMLEFLGLRVDPVVEQNLRNSFDVEFNTTRKIPLKSKILTAAFIKEKATDLMPALQAEIQTNGVDRARLVSTTSPGRFSFLTGSARSEYLRY